MLILTLNAGSSSIKYKVYDSNKEIISGLIEGIGEARGQWHHQQEHETRSFADHQQAFELLAHKLTETLHGQLIEGVGHRVVHGGTHFYQPTRITPDVLAEIKKLSQLAPLHNPVNVLGIECAQKLFKEAVHVAIFDTGFHHSMPDYIRTYAIDHDVARKYHIQRYGFHGINHEYVALQAASFLQQPLSACNLISLHLGNGASACLIKQGLSFDTSMGMTPLAGLIMGTRCGDIDPAIPLYLQQQGFNATDVDTLLNKHSGLKGISGDNDMRAILQRAALNDESASLAIAMYVYAIQKMVAAFVGQIERLDALIFTGGVGENSDIIRDKVLRPLRHLGFNLDTNLNEQRSKQVCRAVSAQGIPVLVIRADEERLMAEKVALMTTAP